MKNKKYLAIVLCVCFFATASVFAQQTISKPTTTKKLVTIKVDKSHMKVQKHTVMEQFEPNMVDSADERMQKKEQRVADTELKISILDTLNISDYRKRKLLLDLKYAPYSNRLHKATLVETEFDETSNEDK